MITSPGSSRNLTQEEPAFGSSLPPRRRTKNSVSFAIGGHASLLLVIDLEASVPNRAHGPRLSSSLRTRLPTSPQISVYGFP